MKKIILTGLCILMCMTAAVAATLTGKQDKLCKQIGTYLEEQGYNIEQRSDGLAFNADGNKYYVEIDSEMQNPMFVSIRRYIHFSQKLTRDKILSNIIDYNSSYLVKIRCEETSVILSTDLFVTEISDFTVGFDYMLVKLQDVENEIFE